MLKIFKRNTSDLTVRSRKVFQRQGPGGRSSNNGLTATIFGATGMLGRNLTNTLGRQGTTIITPYRGSDDDRRFLKLMGDLGKIVQLRYDLRDEKTISECVRHSDIVYNFIGRNYETKNFTFDQVHNVGARMLARVAKQEGVQKFVHVSALGAHVDSKSAFLKSKALGEIAVKEEFPEATIVRPGWMYGYEDSFFNTMGAMAKWLPLSIIFAPTGNAVIRPVFVEDVANALSMMASEDEASGEIVELYGFIMLTRPKAYEYPALIEMFQDASMNQNHTILVPKNMLKLATRILSAFTVFPVYHPDEVERVLIIN